MGEIRSKASQASQKARVVRGCTRRVAELEENWLKAAGHLETLREQMRFETHVKQVRFRRRSTQRRRILCDGRFPRCINRMVGVMNERREDENDSVSDMDMRNVDDVDNELPRH